MAWQKAKILKQQEDTTTDLRMTKTQNTDNSKSE
jgi:hypothetical protein